jgi:hypothetical protein
MSLGSWEFLDLLIQFNVLGLGRTAFQSTPRCFPTNSPLSRPSYRGSSRIHLLLGWPTFYEGVAPSFCVDLGRPVPASVTIMLLQERESATN